MKELVLGAGHARKKRIFPDGNDEYKNPVFLDIEPATNPDVVHDLNVHPLPFEDNTFDEIHAYDILEHLSTQGNYKFFFEEFGEYHRILKPGGIMIILTPKWDGKYAWCDPGHTRVFTPITFSYLMAKHYEKNMDKTSSTDYRPLVRGWWQVYVQLFDDWEMQLTVLTKV